MSIGIVYGSMKPVHRGHWHLITRAAEENDEVLLYVSTTDRAIGHSGIMLKGVDMVDVWERLLKPHLPGNVFLHLGGSPVRKVYEKIGEFNELKADIQFRVYSDPPDIEQRFPEKNRVKYFEYLHEKGLVTFVPVERTDDLDISGTKMREFLILGKEKEFKAGLPECVDRDGVWKRLGLGLFIEISKKRVGK